jgi:hypothetical protein
MDSDLAESLKALKDAFSRRHLRAEFGKAENARVETLRSRLKLPRRFQEFLLEPDPLKWKPRRRSNASHSSVGRLLDEQKGTPWTTPRRRSPARTVAGVRLDRHRSRRCSATPTSSLASPDAEGDCAVLGDEQHGHGSRASVLRASPCF